MTDHKPGSALPVSSSVPSPSSAEGRDIRKYSIVIPTVNRGESYAGLNRKNFIQRTMNSLHRSKVLEYKDCYVNIVESGSTNRSYLDFAKEERFQSVIVHWNEERIMWPENFVRCMKIGASQATHVMLMEDDVDLIPDFMEEVDAFVTKYPNEKIWKMGGSYHYLTVLASQGVDMARTDGYYGNQCVIFTRENAISVSKCIEEWKTRRPDAVKGVDICIKKYWFPKIAKPGEAIVCMKTPSAIQHIGDESSLCNKGCIDGINYPSFYLNKKLFKDQKGDPYSKKKRKRK